MGLVLPVLWFLPSVMQFAACVLLWGQLHARSVVTAIVVTLMAAYLASAAASLGA
jgi:hypothetical protein